LAKLQKPDFVYMRGAIRPWDDAVLHVSTEAVTRGLNVFEGLKGYWSSDSSSFGIVALPRHFARLQRSARLLHIPCPISLSEFEDAAFELLRKLLKPDRDMWIRATLYVVEGQWGEGTQADLVLTAYHQDKSRPTPVRLGVSTWQRSSDISLPPRIKTSTNYQVARLARIEGRRQGYSEMVLLNQWGRVAETTGACILVVRDGTICTPQTTEGALESITIDLAEEISRSLGIPFVRRPVDRTELCVADEISIAGTLSELAKVTHIDGYDLPDKSPLLDAISECFWSSVRQDKPHPAVDLSMVRF
jgi:branched-chain amino acid aminotransferase